MSKFMLDDVDAMDDVNPFVTHDFSLPGGVRQTGDFDNFNEVDVHDALVLDKSQKSVFCAYGLCKDETKVEGAFENIHPRRNIECDLPPPPPIVGVSNTSNTPLFTIALCTLIILSAGLLYARR